MAEKVRSLLSTAVPGGEAPVATPDGLPGDVTKAAGCDLFRANKGKSLPVRQSK
jgi:hypothetical protein